MLKQAWIIITVLMVLITGYIKQADNIYAREVTADRDSTGAESSSQTAVNSAPEGILFDILIEIIKETDANRVRYGLWKAKGVVSNRTDREITLLFPCQGGRQILRLAPRQNDDIDTIYSPRDSGNMITHGLLTRTPVFPVLVTFDNPEGRDRWMFRLEHTQGDNKAKLVRIDSLSYESLMASKPKGSGRVARGEYRYWVSLLSWCHDDRVIALIENAYKTPNNGVSRSVADSALRRLTFLPLSWKTKEMNDPTAIMKRWRGHYKRRVRILDSQGWVRAKGRWGIRPDAIQAMLAAKSEKTESHMPVKIKGGYVSLVEDALGRLNRVAVLTVFLEPSEQTMINIENIRVCVSGLSSGEPYMFYKDRQIFEPIALDEDARAIAVQFDAKAVNLQLEGKPLILTVEAVLVMRSDIGPFFDGAENIKDRQMTYRTISDKVRIRVLSF